MHSTGVHVHILRNAVDKVRRAYSLKWLQWHKFLRSNAVKLQLCWTCMCRYILLRWPNEHVASKLLYRSKSKNYQPKKKVKQISLGFSLTTWEHSLFSSLSKHFIQPCFNLGTANLQGLRSRQHEFLTQKRCDRTAGLDMN